MSVDTSPSAKVSTTKKSKPKLRAWRTSGLHRTMVRTQLPLECTDLLVNVAGNSGANVLPDLMRLIQNYGANIKSGFGGQLSSLAAGMLHVSVPNKHLLDFQSDLDLVFHDAPEAFEDLNMDAAAERSEPMAANKKLTVFVDHDRPGVLAEVMLYLSQRGVNIVNMTAATAPNMFGSWGRAEMKVYVPSHVDVDDLWNTLESVAVEQDWQFRMENLV